MAKNKIGFQFKGYEELMAKYDAAGGKVKPLVEKILKATHEDISKKLHRDMHSHNRTKTTENSIKDDSNVLWSGNTAEIAVGFNFKKGGLPSVFLMYGTPRRAKRGTMPRDKKLYNDIYGKKGRLQKNIYSEEIKKLLGK